MEPRGSMEPASVHTVIRALPLCAVLGVCSAGYGGCGVEAPPVVLAETPARAVLQTLSFGDYDAVLQTYVDDHGMVNYAALKVDSQHLDAFLHAAAKLDPAVYDRWLPDQQIAFWINAYNGLTLRAILDHYPIQPSRLRSLVYPKNSIRQISGVWDELEWDVMGRRMTLNNIEHDILRVDFDEPRIHAALVCAAIGCPPLRNEAYTAENLDAQLDDQMRQFLTHPDKFRIDRTNNRVYLSKILEWYGSDFVKRYGTHTSFKSHSEVERAVLNAVSPYLSEGDRAYLTNGTYTIEYLDYDWSLNEQVESTP